MRTPKGKEKRSKERERNARLDHFARLPVETSTPSVVSPNAFSFFWNRILHTLPYTLFELFHLDPLKTTIIIISLCIKFKFYNIRVLMIMTMLKEHPTTPTTTTTTTTTATALGSDILTDTSGPEEEVIFDEENDDDEKDDKNNHDNYPPSLTKSIVSPYCTPTPIKKMMMKKTKKKKKKSIDNNNSDNNNSDNNNNSLSRNNDHDSSNDETMPVRKLDFSLVVKQLRKKKGSKEKNLLGDLQAMMMRSTILPLSNNDEGNSSNNNNIINKKRHMGVYWFWYNLAIVLLLSSLSLLPVAVYRNPDLPRQLRDYVQVLLHAHSYKIRMELAEQELGQTHRNSSHLQTQIESLQEQAQHYRHNYQIVQAELKSIEESLITLMGSANATQQVNLELKQELQQTVTAKEQVEARWKEQSDRVNDLLQQYNMEQDKCKVLEMEREQAVALAQKYRQDLERWKKTSLLMESDFARQLAETRRQLQEQEEEKIEEYLNHRRRELEQQIIFDLQHQREQQEIELSHAMAALHKEQYDKMIHDLEQQIRAVKEQEQITSSMPPTMPLKQEQLVIAEMLQQQHCRQLSVQLAPIKQVVKKVHVQIQKRVVIAGESFMRAAVHTTEVSFLKGTFHEGESIFTIPRILRIGIPNLLHTTKTQVVTKIQHLSELRLGGISKDVRQKTIARVVEVTQSVKTFAAQVATTIVGGIGQKVFQSMPVQNLVHSDRVIKAVVYIHKTIERVNQSLSVVQVQSTQSAFLKGAFKEGEPLFVMPNAFRTMTSNMGCITKIVSVHVGDMSSHSLRHLSLAKEGILKVSQEQSRIVTTRLGKSIGNISISSKKQFVRVKDAVLSNTRNLLVTVEEQFDKATVSNMGKIDRGADALTILGSFVESQTKIVSREVCKKTNVLKTAGTTLVKVIGNHDAVATFVALSKTSSPAGRASRAIKEYVTRQTAIVVEESKRLISTVDTMRKEITTTIDQHRAAALSHSTKSKRQGKSRYEKADDDSTTATSTVETTIESNNLSSAFDESNEIISKKTDSDEGSSQVVEKTGQPIISSPPTETKDDLMMMIPAEEVVDEFHPDKPAIESHFAECSGIPAVVEAQVTTNEYDANLEPHEQIHHHPDDANVELSY
jgi:hypothetical protein